MLRAQSYSGLDNYPTLRVNFTWYSDWYCQDLVLVAVLVQCFQYPLVLRPMYCFSDQSEDLIFQVVELNLVDVELCFHQSAVSLWKTTLMYAALTMALGIGSFGDERIL